jgi:hypothetical protein
LARGERSQPTAGRRLLREVAERLVMDRRSW